MKQANISPVQTLQMRNFQIELQPYLHIRVGISSRTVSLSKLYISNNTYMKEPKQETQYAGAAFNI